MIYVFGSILHWYDVFENILHWFDTFGNKQGGSGVDPLFYESISDDNTQGYKPNTASQGKTAYEDAISLLSNADEYDINLLFIPGIVDNFSDNFTNGVFPTKSETSRDDDSSVVGLKIRFVFKEFINYSFDSSMVNIFFNSCIFLFWFFQPSQWHGIIP